MYGGAEQSEENTENTENLIYSEKLIGGWKWVNVIETWLKLLQA